MKFKNRKNKLKILSIFGILSATVIITTPILLNKNPIILVNSNNLQNSLNNYAIDESVYNKFQINAETNWSLFSEIFPNDKGFGGDWLNAARDNDQSFITQKIQQLQTYLNNNKSKVLKVPSDNLNIRVIEFIIGDATTTWDVKWEVSTIDGSDLGLPPTDPSSIQITFKNVLDSSPIIINLSTEITNKVKALSPQEAEALTVNQVKQWIADYFNQNKAELPNDFFPPSGTFTLNDLSVYDDKISITQTGVSIGDVQIGRGSCLLAIHRIPEITFTQPSDNTNNKPVDKNYDGDNWQPYVIFGTSGVFLIILAILIIFYIRKRSKNKKEAVAD